MNTSRDYTYTFKRVPNDLHELFAMALYFVVNVLKLTRRNKPMPFGALDNDLCDSALMDAIYGFAFARSQSKTPDGIKSAIIELYAEPHPRYGFTLRDMVYLIGKSIEYHYSVGPRMRRHHCSSTRENPAYTIGLNYKATSPFLESYEATWRVHQSTGILPDVTLVAIGFMDIVCDDQYYRDPGSVKRINNLVKLWQRFNRVYGLPLVFDV
jgi:hypothetical protein